MFEETAEQLITWKSDSIFCGGVFDVESKQKRIHELNQLTAQPILERRRKSPSRSQGTIRFKTLIGVWEKHHSDLEEARFFLDVAQEEKSEKRSRGCGENRYGSAKSWRRRTHPVLGGPDTGAMRSSTFIRRVAEAQDWAEILLVCICAGVIGRLSEEILEYQPAKRRG